MSRLPLYSFLAWTLAVCFVPYWLGVTVGIGWAPATLIAGVALFALLPLRRVQPGLVDLVLITILIGYFLATAIGAVSFASGAVLITQWGFGYLLGRAITTKLSVGTISLVLSIVFGVVAALAVLEFALAWNPFVQLDFGGSLYQTWGGLQERGGVLRAEGAFGHAIALGVSLALAIPLMLTAPIREWMRIGLTLLTLVAIVLTFSRTAMLCAVLGVVLSLLFLKGAGSLRLRLGLLAGGAALTAAVFPFVSATFALAGDEASNSAEYRGDLLPLVSQMQLLGQSPAQFRAADGDLYYGQFRSIDSSLILMGLTYGIVPMLLIVALVVAGVVLVLRGTATAPTVAVVAHIPALLSVALITQYAILLWFMVGLAVSTQQLASRRTAGPFSSTIAVPGVGRPEQTTPPSIPITMQ